MRLSPGKSIAVEYHMLAVRGRASTPVSFFFIGHFGPTDRDKIFLHAKTPSVLVGNSGKRPAVAESNSHTLSFFVMRTLPFHSVKARNKNGVDIGEFLLTA